MSTETRSVRTFDVIQAAQYLGVHPNSVRRWANHAVIPGFRDTLAPGGPWRFTQADLDAFRAKRQTSNQTG